MTGDKKTVFMIGPSLKTQGGISSVLYIYSRNFKGKMDMRFISSYSGRNRVMDILFFAAAVLEVFYRNISCPNPVFHIHVASGGSYLRKSILARICLAFRHNVILHVHGAMFDQFVENLPEKRKRRLVALFNRADRVVVLSRYWHSYFAAFVPQDRLRILYNPSSTYQKGISRAYGKSGKQVLFMGRLGERKGVYDLIRAAAKLRDIDFSLNLYGDGEVAAVRELVEREGLGQMISVNNWVPHSRIGELFDNAELMVLPSYAEGLPMSLLEAVGRGLAVVSTNVGGIPEIIEEGRNGFLIEPGDVDALADRLRTLLTTPGLLERMGRESLAIAGEKFSIEQIELQLQELYRSL